MAAPEPVTAAEAWVFSRLNGHQPLRAIVGSRIFPSYAPPTTASPFVVHDFGGGEPVGPLGPYGPTAYLLLWDISVWGSGQGRQALRGAMSEALEAVVGPGLAGIVATYTDPAGTVWHVSSHYDRPVPVPPVPTDFSEGAWTRVAHTVRLAFQLG